MRTRNDLRTLAERADLEDEAAERAAMIARHAERQGYLNGADMLWKIADRCRIDGLKLRALAEAQRVLQQRPS
jgi:hypothetical protein